MASYNPHSTPCHADTVSKHAVEALGLAALHELFGELEETVLADDSNTTFTIAIATPSNSHGCKRVNLGGRQQ
jgi:hypothetical protein